MLKKSLRFHSRGGVRYTYAHGKTIRTPKISLVYNDNSRGYQRFAVVVSKKVEKSAVKRNHIRRRVYEAIRAEYENAPKKRDFIFVVYSKDIAMMDFAELQSVIRSLFSQSMI